MSQMSRDRVGAHFDLAESAIAGQVTQADLPAKQAAAELRVSLSTLKRWRRAL